MDVSEAVCVCVALFQCFRSCQRGERLTSCSDSKTALTNGSPPRQIVFSFPQDLPVLVAPLHFIDASTPNWKRGLGGACGLALEKQGGFNYQL